MVMIVSTKGLVGRGRSDGMGSVGGVQDMYGWLNADLDERQATLKQRIKEEEEKRAMNRERVRRHRAKKKQK